MSLISRVKKALIGLTFLGALAAPAAAQESKPQSPGPQSVETKVNEPTRILYPLVISNNEPADPRNGFEANTHAWYTTNQLIGKGSDILGQELGLDKYDAVRPFFLLLHHYVGTFSDYLSHETAHNYVSRKEYHDALAFEFGLAGKYNYNPLIFFRNKSNTTDNLPLEEFLQSITSGMNQQECNAQFLHEQAITNNRIYFDEGWSFGINRFQNIGYMLRARDNIGPISEQRGSIKDPEGYRAGLGEKGIKLSADALLLQSVIPTALSTHTYNSFFAVMGGYLGKGQRSIEPWWMDDLHDGAKSWAFRMTPPLVTHYMTPEGGFWNTSVFIRTKQRYPVLVELNFGTDVDFIGDGNLNTLRFGAKLHDISLLSRDRPGPKASVYAHVNFTRKSFEYAGMNCGIEVAVPVSSGMSITGKVEGNANDTIENKVELERNGFNASVGLKIKF